LEKNIVQHVPVQQYKSNLEKIIGIAKEMSDRILVISPTPCNVEAWKKYRALDGRFNDRR
jgi:hypothetical protein